MLSEHECYEKIKQCPRFLTCSVPVCPLDPMWEQRTFIKGEPKCRMPKSELKKIGYFPQVKARTNAGKAQHKNWLLQQGKAQKNLKHF